MTVSALRGILELIATVTVSLAIQAGFYNICLASLAR